MAFQLWKKPSQGKRELLLSLKNRLETSTYEEDIIEALESIYEMSLDIPDLVVEICFISIIKSLKFTEECIPQIKVLQILSFTNKQGQIHILKNEELRSIILSKSAFFISVFIKIFNSQDLISFLALDFGINEIIKKLVASEYYKEAELVIKDNQILKEALVFEGIFESILAIKDSHIKNREEAKSSLIREILSNSTKNQYYFAFSCLDLVSISKIHTDVLICILDPISKHFNEIQMKLWSNELILESLKTKNYKLLYLLILKNSNTFDEFVSKYLALDQLLIDTDNDVWAFKILEYLIRSTTLEIKSSQSFRINTLLFNLGMDFELPMLSREITIDQAIYMIFTLDGVNDLGFSIDPNIFNEPVNMFVVLLNLIHENPIKMSDSQIVSSLSSLRKFLINNEITVDSLKDQLIGTINQFLIEKTSFPERKIYQVSESKPKIVKEAEVVESQTPDKKILEEVKNNIFGIFDKFKSKSDNDKKSFDL